MPPRALVLLRFGLSRRCGQLAHWTGRLRGLQAVLEADGHQVILEEIPDWNVVELVVNGETVLQCNIKDLNFGGDGKLDPLCEEARVAVLNAY
ncbi:PREDICTED: UPF0728 protein C10orf53 homolog [Gavialis gangeticus]|uniref:UPF0728 protein C10orf53 homolog n=1 Tax=Gavialis gangeticus TaxID=94835 RepID=UPI00092E7C62|nr:PREDICTED: UPF0728 protein C10orf53 homolog [Gavialis gangeticus]